MVRPVRPKSILEFYVGCLGETRSGTQGGMLGCGWVFLASKTPGVEEVFEEVLRAEKPDAEELEVVLWQSFFFLGGGGDGQGMESDIRRFGSKETLTQFFGGFTQFTHHSAQD